MFSSRVDRAAILAVSGIFLALTGVALPGCGGSAPDERAGSRTLISAKDAETTPATPKARKAQEAESEIFRKNPKLR